MYQLLKELIDWRLKLEHHWASLLDGRDQELAKARKDAEDAQSKLATRMHAAEAEIAAAHALSMQMVGQEIEISLDSVLTVSVLYLLYCSYVKYEVYIYISECIVCMHIDIEISGRMTSLICL